MSGAAASCGATQERIHEIFDGDDPSAVPRQVTEHLATCASCRELYEDLTRLRAILREAPAAAFPGATLDAVWAATVKSRASRRVPVPWLRAAAAAVVATALIATTYVLTRPGSGEPSRNEILKAEAQADLVFGYTAKALTATRDAAADRVVAARIAPAMREGSGAAAGRRD